MTEMEDTYAGGTLLRRWTLVGGYPRCVEDAVRVAEIDEETVSAVLAANAAIREAVAAVETHEAAARLAAEPEPDADPGRAAWLAAVDLVAAASPAVLTLAAQRAGEGEAA